MIILSHRGYWRYAEERNTRKAFERSFAMGFGTETDIRDHKNQLVISHDMPDSSAMTLKDFFEIYKYFGGNLSLALNIKADGLQVDLKRLLNEYQICNYFVFDMAVPDGLAYVKEKFRTYTRQSEYEQVPSFYDLAQGVWLDEFNGHWLSDDVILKHIERRKEVCIVSPDLHKRDHSQEWQHYKSLEKLIGKDQIMLCTDFPELAREYFNA